MTPIKIWRGQKAVQKIIGLTGEILTFTRIYAPPAGFNLEAPYAVAIVELDNGLRYTAQLVDYNESELKTGQKVVAVLRRTREMGPEGVISYGVKFKPL